ncbi:MAG: hypothetical protein K2L75_02345 [Muribaculaceae bacterium]|nr:hypothetical protein [Muribaculaceae bacterium]
MEKTLPVIIRLAVMAAAVIFAANGAAARWDIAAGVRDSRYIYADVTYDSHVSVAAEHSVYSYDIGYQYWRLYTGGCFSVPYADFDCKGFYGRTWAGTYYSAGALIACRILPPGPVSVFAILNPLYDSDFRYTTCFAAGVSVKVCRPVSLRASYTTIPEFRESEKVVRAGFDVHVGGLSVVPELSIPVDPRNRSRKLRMLMSFSYKFSLGR